MVQGAARSSYVFMLESHGWLSETAHEQVKGELPSHEVGETVEHQGHRRCPLADMRPKWSHTFQRRLAGLLLSEEDQECCGCFARRPVSVARGGQKVPGRRFNQTV